MRLCQSTFLLVTCFACLGVGPGVVVSSRRYESPVLAASTEFLELPQATPAIAQISSSGTASQNRLQADDVTKVIIAANQNNHSRPECRSEWVWLRWLFVLIGVLGVVGALRYLQKRFGKAGRSELLAQRSLKPPTQIFTLQSQLTVAAMAIPQTSQQ